MTIKTPCGSGERAREVKKEETLAFHPRALEKEREGERERKEPANEINRTTRAPFASGVPAPAQHAWIGARVTHRRVCLP